jgi:hypothetical protein
MKHIMNQKLSSKAIQRGLWMGALLLTAATASAQYNTTLNFTVDMSAQLTASTFNPPPPQGTGTDQVWVQGSFHSWGHLNLSPASSSPTETKWVGSILDVSDGNIGGENSISWLCGDTQDNYETTACYDNRAYYLPAANNTTLNMPYTYFGDLGPASATPTAVTFSVDMGAEAALGNFIIGTDTISVHGSWDGWSGDAMTQVTPPNGTVYSVTITAPFTRPICSSIDAANDFKYVATSGTLAGINGGYEDPSPVNSDESGNRWFIFNPNGESPLILATVYYSDITAPHEEYLTSDDCMVTFNVDMTGAVGTDGYVFGSDAQLGGGQDVVCINGVYQGTSPNWDGWATGGAPYVAGPLIGLTLSPSEANPNIWTITLPINAGNSENLTYKYSINGWDDEAGFNDNHTRWIRDTNMVALGGSWTMPTDVFGSQGNATSVELNFGKLTISPDGTKVTLTWVGHNGVALQTASSLSGTWTQVANTDGTVLDVSDPSIGEGATAALGTATINISANQPAAFYRLVEISP